jgi:uncharacterized cofD-like protein
MPQFGSQSVPAEEELVIGDDPAADAGADGQVEQIPAALARAKPPFSQRSQIGVIADEDGQVQGICQPLTQREFVHIGDVGGIDHALLSVGETSSGNPEGKDFPLGWGHIPQSRNQPFDGCAVTPGGDFQVGDRGEAVFKKGGGAYLRAAEIRGEKIAHEGIISGYGGTELKMLTIGGKTAMIKKRMQPSKKSWRQQFVQWLRLELRWLVPGLGIKRWIALILIGTTLLGLGFAVFLLDFYRTAPQGWVAEFLRTISLSAIDRTPRAIIFGIVGILLVIAGTWGLGRSLLSPFLRPGKKVIEQMSAHRRRGRGPHVVAIGGGNGLAALLRGLKKHTNNITAIVTVADDGGSSGELRRNMGVLPPGDIRNCLAALSDDEEMISQIFQYRFAAGSGLEGHSLGNLLITAMTDITGSFEKAVAESGKVLAVQGRVLPATLHDVRLVADVQLKDGAKVMQVKGESQIPKAEGEVRRVWLEPNNPLAFPPALQALLTADLIVIGPGSLYTSILPNLLVPDLAEAIRVSRALKFYICNIASQRGETDFYSCGDHVRAIEKHLNGGSLDMLICNQNFDGALPHDVNWVLPEEELAQNYPVYMSDLVDRENPWRHDSVKLAQAIIDLYNERTGPMANREEI